MTLTDERRKALMKYLGDGVDRSFTTDADMMALFRKMVDTNKWVEFSHTAIEKFRKEKVAGSYNAWLFYEPERFCCLVAEWLEVTK
jgi:hypothetical protein